MTALIFIAALIICIPLVRFLSRVIGIALFMALRIGALVVVIAFVIMFCLA